MPETVAEPLMQALQSDESRRLMRVCWADIDARVNELRSTPAVDKKVVEHLEQLLASVRQSKEKAQRPPRDYQAFSRTVLELSDQMKDLIEELPEELRVDEPPF